MCSNPAREVARNPTVAVVGLKDPGSYLRYVALENRLLVEPHYQKVYRARVHARLASICRTVQY